MSKILFFMQLQILLQGLLVTFGGMFSFVVAEPRGAMARFLQIAAQLASFLFGVYLSRRCHKYDGY